jgi:hypothetical protein
MTNFSRTHKRAIALALALSSIFLVTGCRGKTSDQKAREQAQSQKATGATLEKTNLAAKRKLEENPNRIGYLYLMSFGKFIGYYVTKGKISSNGSQATPEQDAVRYCQSGDCSWLALDGPQDDGSYGSGDPGIFFFTAEGKEVVTSLDYVYSDQPLTLPGVPELAGQR